MKKLWHFLRHPSYFARWSTSLGMQLTSLIMLLIALPTLIFTLYTLKQQNDITQQDLIKNSYEYSVQLAGRVNSLLKSYAAVSNLFYLDDSLNGALVDYRDGLKGLEETQQIIRKVSDRYNAGMIDGGFSVLAVAADGTVFGNAVFGNKPMHLALSEQSWLDKLYAGAQTQLLWQQDTYLDSLFSFNGYPNIYLIRRIQERKNWTDIGTLILIISETEIRHAYESYVEDSKSLFVLDQAMQVVSSMDNLHIFTLTEEMKQSMLSYSGTVWPTASEKADLATFYTVGTTKWKLVYFQNTDDVMRPFWMGRWRYLLLMLLCITVSAVLSGFVIQHFISPIKVMRKQMERVRDGNMDAKLIITSKNEIGQLSEDFNLMLNSLDLLMQRLIEEGEAKRNAEIRALQSQINPHFLYNTLASVRSMIYVGEKEQADNIIVCLIHLMKNALSDSQRFITFDLELRLLNDYIQIQQHTFEDGFAVEINVSPEIRNCYTIKLLLQPIVENAIFHGLKPKGNGCLLKISAEADDNSIDLTIWDNGAGFCSQNLPLVKEASHGIGMQNVNDRIQMYFGKAYGVHVSGNPREGTAVRLHLPKLKSREEGQNHECNNC